MNHVRITCGGFSQIRSHDGAGAMAGQVRGAAARTTDQYPKAFHPHCAAHALNLCVVKCCPRRKGKRKRAVSESIGGYNALMHCCTLNDYCSTSGYTNTHGYKQLKKLTTLAFQH